MNCRWFRVPDLNLRQSDRLEYCAGDQRREIAQETGLLETAPSANFFNGLITGSSRDGDFVSAPCRHRNENGNSPISGGVLGKTLLRRLDRPLGMSKPPRSFAEWGTKSVAISETSRMIPPGIGLLDQAVCLLRTPSLV